MVAAGDDRAANYGAKIAEFAKDHSIALSDQLDIMSPAYDEWIEHYKQKIDEMSDYLPDLSEINLGFNTESIDVAYKNAFDELQSLAKESSIDINFDLNPENMDTEELRSYLDKLKLLDLEIDAELNPAAQSALDTLIDKTET